MPARHVTRGPDGLRPFLAKLKSSGVCCLDASRHEHPEEKQVMKTAILLTSMIVALPLAGMAQPDDRRVDRDEAPPRQGWRGGDDEEFRGPVGPRGLGFRGEFGPGPRARQGAPDQLGPRPGMRRCPNCGWCPLDGPPREQRQWRGQNSSPRRLGPGAGERPAWKQRDGGLPERPAFGPRSRWDEDQAPPLRGRGYRGGRPDPEEED
jgi:hypothetical protein